MSGITQRSQEGHVCWGRCPQAWVTTQLEFTGTDAESQCYSCMNTTAAVLIVQVRNSMVPDGQRDLQDSSPSWQPTEAVKRCAVTCDSSMGLDFSLVLALEAEARRGRPLLVTTPATASS